MSSRKNWHPKQDTFTIKAGYSSVEVSAIKLYFKCPKIRHLLTDSKINFVEIPQMKYPIFHPDLENLRLIIDDYIKVDDPLHSGSIVRLFAISHHLGYTKLMDVISNRLLDDWNICKYGNTDLFTILNYVWDECLIVRIKESFKTTNWWVQKGYLYYSNSIVENKSLHSQLQRIVSSDPKRLVGSEVLWPENLYKLTLNAKSEQEVSNCVSLINEVGWNPEIEKLAKDGIEVAISNQILYAQSEKRTDSMLIDARENLKKYVYLYTNIYKEVSGVISFYLI